MTTPRTTDIKEIKETVNTTAIQVALIVQRLDDYEKTQAEKFASLMEEMKRQGLAIYGNGAPGLKERANQIEGRVTDLEDKHHKSDLRKLKEVDRLQNFKWLLIAYGVTTVIEIVLIALKLK